MNIDILAPELWRRYPFLADESLPVLLGGIREADVARWALEYDGQQERVYDEFARYFAIAFHTGRLSFSLCDAVMNDLHGVIWQAAGDPPALFWQVFLAFDAGGYHRREDQSDDPVEEQTVPAIAAIVENL